MIPTVKPTEAAAVISRLAVGYTHPRHDELSAQILDLGFHLAADVELMTVQGDSLQVGQQVLLARRIRALIRKEGQRNMLLVAHTVFYTSSGFHRATERSSWRV